MPSHIITELPRALTPEEERQRLFDATMRAVFASPPAQKGEVLVPYLPPRLMPGVVPSLAHLAFPWKTR